MKAATFFFIGIGVIYSISIHAAREGGDNTIPRTSTYVLLISIHAAREGGDFSGSVGFTRYVPFQSTPPVKAATFCQARINLNAFISIHAAREGGDLRLP